MANVTVIRLIPPNTVWNFIDHETGKVVATATNNTSVAVSTAISVPPGKWLEQRVVTLAEHGGASRVFTNTSSAETDLELGNATAPVLTDANGGLWQLQVSPVADPVGAPTMAQATSGGSIAAGVYTCGYTWVTPAGESKLSPTAPVTTTTGASTITFSAIPALPQGAYGYNLYVSAAGVPGTLYKQGNTFTSGASQTLTAALVTNTANPPSASSAGLVTATKVA